MVVRELITKLGFKTDEAAIKRADKGFQGLRKTALGLSAAAVGLGAGLAAGIGSLVKKAAEMEQVQIAFETMLGSGEKAKKLLEDITNFAATTPFQLTGLIENSKKLLAFGFQAEEITSTMQNLGNVAAGIGKDKLPTLVAALGKIRVKGKASMEELNMALEAGTPILGELAKNLGVTEKQLFKMISQGKVGFKDVNQAFATMSTGSGRFANLMIKQSKSFLGVISNLQDFLEVTAIQLGNEFLPEAKKVAGAVLNWVDANRELIKQNLRDWALKLKNGIFAVYRNVRRLIRSISGLLDRLGGIEGVAKFATVALTGLYGAKVSTALADLTGALIGIVRNLKTIQTVSIGISGAFGAIAGAILAGVAAAILFRKELKEMARTMNLGFLVGDKFKGKDALGLGSLFNPAAGIINQIDAAKKYFDRATKGNPEIIRNALHELERAGTITRFSPVGSTVANKPAAGAQAAPGNSTVVNQTNTANIKVTDRAEMERVMNSWFGRLMRSAHNSTSN